MMTRHGILRERFADSHRRAAGEPAADPGYRVEVMEFVDSKHTPRNTLIRAVRTGAARSRAARCATEYDDLVATWGIRPKLAELLDGPTPDDHA